MQSGDPTPVWGPHPDPHKALLDTIRMHNLCGSRTEVVHIEVKANGKLVVPVQIRSF